MCRPYLIFLITTLITTDSIFGGVLECDSDNDCIDEASCIENICECPKGYVFSLNGYRCLKYSIGYGSSCEDDAQCAWLMGKYYCNSGACDCEAGYRYLHGRCVQSKGLGEQCTKDEECHVTNYFSAMVCSDEGVCVCNEGYYARGGYDCRPEATELGDDCALDSDCKMDNAYCYLYKCISTSTRANATFDYSVSESQREERDVITYAIGTSCTTSEDCEDNENAICSPLTNECVCKRGYYYNSARGCIGELGTDIGCTQNSDCSAFSFSSCIDGACVCNKTHYYSKDLTRCWRVAYVPNFVCQDDISCQINSNEAQCILVDTSRTCYCPLNTMLNEDNICEAYENNECGIETCITASDCSNTNAVCTSGECSCPDNYRLEDNTCLPNIGGACDSSTKICQIDNAACAGSVCSCIENYAPLNETSCVTVTAALYDTCEYDVQCSFVIENSLCIDQQCQCGENYSDKDGECLEIREYGSYCDNIRQCQVVLGENIQCRNSICQCAANMIRTDDGLDCRIKSNDAATIQTSVILLIFACVVYFI